MTSTLSVIQPILTATYGKGDMVQGMAEHLSDKIDAGDFGHYASRQDMVCSVCWDWMTGGSTAQAVAKKIEAALIATETERGHE